MKKKKDKVIVEDAKELKKTLIVFAHAVATPFDQQQAVDGLWVTDYADLKEFIIQYTAPDRLEGVHNRTYMEEYGGYANAFFKTQGVKLEPKEKTQRVNFSGIVMNYGIKYSISISSEPQKTTVSVLPDMSSVEYKGFAILAKDISKINFYIEKEGKLLTFMATKKKSS